MEWLGISAHHQDTLPKGPWPTGEGLERGSDQHGAACPQEPNSHQVDLPCGIAEVQTLVLQRGSAFSHSQTYFPREGTEARGG